MILELIELNLTSTEQFLNLIDIGLQKGLLKDIYTNPYRTNLVIRPSKQQSSTSQEYQNPNNQQKYQMDISNKKDIHLLS